MAPINKIPLHVLDLVCGYLRRKDLDALSLTNRLWRMASERHRFADIEFRARDPKKMRDDVDRWNEILTIDNRYRHVRKVKVWGHLFLPDLENVLLDAPEYETSIPSRQVKWIDDSDCLEDDLPVVLINPREDGGCCLRRDFYKLKENWDSEPDAEHTSDIRVHGCFNTVKQGFDRGSNPRQLRNIAWQPLAQLVNRLPGLRNFVFACTHQIPPCLFTALDTHYHQHPHQRIRLHMKHFWLRTTYQRILQGLDPGGSVSIHQDDYALVTSPCLYSINRIYQVYGEPWERSNSLSYSLTREHDMVARLATWLAPSLKEVTFMDFEDNEDEYTFEAKIMPWDDIIDNEVTDPGLYRQIDLNGLFASKPQGRLQSLSLCDNGIIQNREWLDRTDVSGLVHFRNQDRRVDYITAKRSIIQTITPHQAEKLTSLRTLELCIARHDGNHTAQDWDNTLACFLSALPRPLQELYLDGHFGLCTFDAAMVRHGHNLRELRMRPAGGYTTAFPPLSPSTLVFSKERVREVQKRCPNLEMISLVVPRSWGDADEVDIYRALGGLRRLRRAALWMADIVPDHKEQYFKFEPEFQEEEDSAEKGESREKQDLLFKHKPDHVRLLNLAIDADLARSIFNTIARANPNSRLSSLFICGGSHLLGRLLDKDDYFIYDHSFRADTLDWVRRSWVCNVKDGWQPNGMPPPFAGTGRDENRQEGESETSRGTLTIRECLANQARIGNDFSRGRNDWPSPPPEFADFWNKRWPTTDQTHWADCWKSLPLSSTRIGPGEI